MSSKAPQFNDRIAAFVATALAASIIGCVLWFGLGMLGWLLPIELIGIAALVCALHSFCNPEIALHWVETAWKILLESWR